MSHIVGGLDFSNFLEVDKYKEILKRSPEKFYSMLHLLLKREF
jgi:hypothetical protein